MKANQFFEMSRTRRAKKQRSNEQMQPGGKPFEDGVIGNETRGILVYI